MNCPECKTGRSEVFDSRRNERGVYRRRRCYDCAHRFSTQEEVVVRNPAPSPDRILAMRAATFHRALRKFLELPELDDGQEMNHGDH